MTILYNIYLYKDIYNSDINYVNILPVHNVIYWSTSIFRLCVANSSLDQS